MKTTTKRLLALTGILALGLTAVRAQSDGALLDALVKKGVLSDQEAEDIRANEAKDYATTAAGKLAISDHITQLKLYGDARFRFEYADEKPQNTVTIANAAAAPGGAKSGDNVIERNRYRLRVGADYTFTDQFNAGFELETNGANDSANQTLGSAYGKAAINIGLIYLQWKPTDWLTLTGGKQRNPLYTTDLVWDPDIAPEGGSEAISWTFPIGGDSPAPASKDPKAMSPVAEPSTMSLTIGFTAFQGIYSDNNEDNGSTVLPGGTLTNATDVWQFVEQVPVQFNFDKDTFIKVVPGFDTYTSGGNTGPGGGPSTAGGGTQNFTGPNVADDLQIVTAPGEVDWKLWSQPFKFYWDFAANLNGKQRIQNVYLGRGQTLTATAGSTVALTQSENSGLGDNVAWLAGLQVGQNKKKGDWSIKGDFRQVGLGSIDPNLNDSDWGDSFLNQQGFKIQSTYNFTDFLTGSLAYTDTWAYKTNLFNGTPGQNSLGLPVQGVAPYTIAGTTAGVTGLANVSTTQRVQVDLQWKF